MLKNPFKKKKKENRFKKFFKSFYAFIRIFLSPKRLKRFVKNEQREISELTSGEQDLKRFLVDSKVLFKNLFIPNKDNDNRPKILRPKSLASYALVAIAVKLVVTGFLFTTYPTPAQLSEIVSANMINLTNQARAEAGLEPLVENAALTKYAQIKGQDMLDRDYFAHNTPDGKRPWQWIEKADYDYVYAGENLAMDFMSAEVVHDAFMKSPSHRRNILNPKYKDIGVAVLKGTIQGRETTLLVKFYGTQRKDLSTLAAVNPEQQSNVAQDFVPNENVNVAGAQNVPDPDATLEVTGSPINNEGIIVVNTSTKASKALVDLVVEYSNIFFIAFLIFMLISLALNIFINIKVQHSSVILQSVVVVALLLSMVLVKLHFVEGVAPQLLIL